MFEVDLDGNVIHVKSLDSPEPTTKKGADATPAESADTENKEIALKPEDNAEPSTSDATAAVDEPSKSEDTPVDANQTTEDQTPDEPWPDRFTESLKPFLSEEVIAKVKGLYLEGPEPPFVSDSGWGGRQPKDGDAAESSAAAAAPQEEAEESGRGKRGRGRGGKGGRGGRGGRDSRGGKHGRPDQREDNRKVLSDVRIPSVYMHAKRNLIENAHSRFPQKRRVRDCTKPFEPFSAENLRQKQIRPLQRQTKVPRS